MTSGADVRVTALPPGGLSALAAAPGLGELFALARADEVLVGRGVAQRFDADVASTEVRHAMRALAREGAPLRALAALPFDPARTPDGVWGALGRGGVVIPRFLGLRRGAEELLVTIGADPPELGGATEQTAGAPRVAREGGDGGTDYEALVQRALGEIAVGTAEKIVPVRVRDLWLDRVPSASGVLGRLLSAATPPATPYTVTGDGRAFVGSTPETLVTVGLGRLGTEAVAGTAKREDGEMLLRSEKDVREHEVVADTLAASLATWGEVRRGPRGLRSTGQVTHLVTPLEVALEAPVHALDAARRLSPTPAVGGFPTARALAFLRCEEGFDRGLFAGALGAFDAEGHGAFVVAIRGALLDDRRVRLFAGAGVVRGSVPARELEETRWKMAAMEAALGVA